MFKNLKLEEKGGFTIIEIIVVVAIIAILVGIIIAAGDSAKKTARDNERVTDIRLLQVKLESYLEKNGVYPATLDQLGLSQMPTDPISKAEYKYAGLSFTNSTAASCLTYHLGTTLETMASVLSQKAGQSALGANRQTGYVLCSGGGAISSNDFDGTASNIYDVVSPDSFQK